jgi:hypothetical protein
METYLLDGISEVRLCECDILQSPGKTAVKGRRGACGGGYFGLCIYMCGNWVTLTHTSTGKDVKTILTLGEMKAGRCTGDRDAEKVMKRAKVLHGKFMCKGGDDSRKSR